MIIDNNFNSGGVHLQAFAEGTALSHEHAAAVTQRTVDGLDDAGLSFALGARPVLVTGHDGGVGFPLIGEVPAVPPVAPGQLLPKATHRGLAPAAQRPGHDAPAGPPDGQPKPNLATFAPHKGPQLVEFEHFPVFFRAQARQRGAIAQRFFYPLGNAHARNASHALDAALRIALAQQLVDLCVLRGLGHGNGYKTRLVAAGFALVAGMALTVPVPLNLVTAAFGAEVLRINHKAYHGFHPDLDHRTIDGGLNRDEN